jgi:hypothetical protein
MYKYGRNGTGYKLSVFNPNGTQASSVEATQHDCKQLLISFSHPPAPQQQAGYFVLGLSMSSTGL